MVRVLHAQAPAPAGDERHLDHGAAHASRSASEEVAWHSLGGTFELSDEPLDEPPRALARARTRAGVREDDFFPLALGQTRKLLRRGAAQ